MLAPYPAVFLELKDILPIMKQPKGVAERAKAMINLNAFPSTSKTDCGGNCGLKSG